MIVTSIALLAMLTARAVDMIHGPFLCFAFALILNAFLGGSMTIVSYGSDLVDIDYQGYFMGKNYIGECAAIVFLLSLHEIVPHSWRRASGIIVFTITIALVFLNNFKTVLGLIIISPFLM